MAARRSRLILQAYRAGLLKQRDTCKWTSRVREEWMLMLMQNEREAELGRSMMLVKSAFAPLLKQPAQVMQQWTNLIQALSEFQEGNPAALLKLANKQDIAPLQELWRAMHAEGML